MMARPLRKFTDEQINQMQDYALSGCQNNTIATIMDIPIVTLVRRFGKLLTKKRAERKHLLRKAQTERAIDSKDTGMLCFLGKNELGQEDKKTIKQESTIVHDVSPKLLALGKEMAKKYAQEAK